MTALINQLVRQRSQRKHRAGRRQDPQGTRATLFSHSILYALTLAIVLLFTATDIARAASAKHNKRVEAAKTIKSHNNKITTHKAARTPVSKTVQGTLDGLHPIKILSLHKKVSPGTLSARAGVGGSASSASHVPAHTTINKGESVTLSWRIKACDAEVNALYFDGGLTASGTGTVSNGCRYFTGERTVTPARTHTYNLRVLGCTDGGTNVERTRSYTVRVAAPHVDILRPEINQNTLAVSVAVRNTGMVDIGPGSITVNYAVNAPNSTGAMDTITGSFTTPAMTINRGTRADLGTFSLADYRERLMAFDRCHILLTLADASGAVIDDEGHTHRWETKTFAINNLLLPALSTMSSYNIRLNNYGGGVHPRVRDDCHFSVNLMGGTFSHAFDLEPEVQDILLAIAPSPIPIMQPVAIYANQISASQDGPTDLLSIRNGKLVIHVEFPNSGSRELKLGFHNWGRHDEFRDSPVADVELGPFSVDILITPELRNGRISYGSVEVQADGVSGSLVGALDDTLNAFVLGYLNDTLESIIVDYLTEVLNNNTMRTSFENGIAEALETEAHVEMTTILDVRGSGNAITVTYR